jgi:hypothetical protein
MKIQVLVALLATCQAVNVKTEKNQKNI